jgi:small-conductance mechanosensitive channel
LLTGHTSIPASGWLATIDETGPDVEGCLVLVSQQSNRQIHARSIDLSLFNCRTMHQSATQDIRFVLLCQKLFPRVTLLLTGFVFLCPGDAAWGQTALETQARGDRATSVSSTDAPQGSPTDQPISLEDVPSRAEITSAELTNLQSRDISRQTLDRVSSQTDRTLQEAESYLVKVRQFLAGRPSVRALQNSASELGEMLKQMRSLEEELDKQLDTLRTALDRIDRISAVWEATDQIANTQTGAEVTTRTRIAAVCSEIDKARLAVVKQRDDSLAVRDKLVNPTIEVDECIKQLQAAIETRLQGVFRADHPPLWSPRVRESLQMEWQNVGPQLSWKRFVENRQLSWRPTEMFGFQLVLFVALALGLLWLRARTRARTEDEDRLRHAQLVFEHPWAIALLITVFLTVPLDPIGSRSMGLLAAAAIAVATLRIVQRYLPPAMTLFAWGLAVLYVIERLRNVLETTPTLERIVFLGEMLGGLGLLIWMLLPSRIASLPEERRRHPFFRLLHAAMWVGAVLVTLAILADLLGWSDLAVLLGDGVLRSGYLGLVAFVLLKAIHSLITFALVLWPFRLLRAISNHRTVVEVWLERILCVLAVGFWLALLLGRLSLLAPVGDIARRVLGASVTFGALSVSVADVLVFALTVWFSLLLARWIQVILQEDVFSRIRASRGVPYAVSNLARYSVIFLGFLVGLSAAGIEVTKLAVVAGGLGVGIGFGLQNVVNNFVSGLILLFERPIDVGDSIELTETSGIMKRIGIRASVIRTFDGAEVIVPNGILISEKVINWTLSDRRRRIELSVGVEYGTPAQKVIDLLVDVAKANPKVIADPEPLACFVNFGDSSLDFKLRAWFEANDFTNIHTIHSEIAVAVQQALDEANIGVPFPQRDLHLISAPANAASALGAELPQTGGVAKP